MDVKNYVIHTYDCVYTRWYTYNIDTGEFVDNIEELKTGEVLCRLLNCFDDSNRIAVENLFCPDINCDSCQTKSKNNLTKAKKKAREMGIETKYPITDFLEASKEPPILHKKVCIIHVVVAINRHEMDNILYNIYNIHLFCKIHTR